MTRALAPTLAVALREAAAKFDHPGASNSACMLWKRLRPQRPLTRATEMSSPSAKKAKTERTFLFSSESVNEGHPDKLADQVQQRARSETLRT